MVEIPSTAVPLDENDLQEFLDIKTHDSESRGKEEAHQHDH